MKNRYIKINKIKDQKHCSPSAWHYREYLVGRKCKVIGENFNMTFGHHFYVEHPISKQGGYIINRMDCTEVE